MIREHGDIPVVWSEISGIATAASATQATTLTWVIVAAAPRASLNPDISTNLDLDTAIDTVSSTMSEAAASFGDRTAALTIDLGPALVESISAALALPSPIGPRPTSRAEEVLAALPDGLCLVTAAGVPLWTNRWYRQLDTVTKERVIAACADAARVFAARPGTGLSRRHDVYSEDPSKTYEVLVSPAPRSATDGPSAPAPIATGVGANRPPASDGEDVVAVIRDVTSARLLARKVDAIDSAGAALVRLDADEVRKMDAITRLALLEEKIVRSFKELLHYDHFVIRIVDKRTGRLEPVMSANFPTEAIELELYPRSEGNGISGYVASSGRDYICYDVSKDERYLPGAEGAASALAVPLRIDDEIIGSLNIESTTIGAFAEEDRRVAVIFARYIAIALKMLDLLVVERSATNASVSDRFAVEISEPLEDILREAQELDGDDHPETAKHIERIRNDVASIRSRLSSVAEGRHTLLGLDQVGGVDRVDPVLNGCRVLVVDDDDQIRSIICDLLRRRGCEVRSANTGQAGIDAIQHAAAASTSFDLVLSDISLPDRNGYEVFSAARDNGSKSAVVLMTGFGYDPHHSIVRASQKGLQCVLFKPFQAKRLIEEVRTAVERHAGSEAP
ncbi:MAG: response regulator [Planctomycetota bacterium]